MLHARLEAKFELLERIRDLYPLSRNAVARRSRSKGPMIEDFFCLFERTRNDMDADQFAHPPCRDRSGFSGRFYRSHITADEHRDITIEEILFANQLHIRRLNHGIGCLYSSHETARLDHP